MSPERSHGLSELYVYPHLFNQRLDLLPIVLKIRFAVPLPIEVYGNTKNNNAKETDQINSYFLK